MQSDMSFSIPLPLSHHKVCEEQPSITFPENTLSFYANKSAKELHGLFELLAMFHSPALFFKH